MTIVAVVTGALTLVVWLALGATGAFAVERLVEGQELFMGGPAMLKRLALTPAQPVWEAADRAAARGQASVYLLTSKAAVAASTVADAVRPESREAIQRLHAQGIEVVMLTGDAKAVADAVTADLGIDTVFSEVYPPGAIPARTRAAPFQRRF